MTLTSHARLAGFAYLFYLVAGISSMMVPADSRGLFNIFESFSALVLGWTLYAITREQDADLALLAMMCRVIEAVPGRGEIYFAVGSTIFCWLLLRGQMIPVALAWLGTAASALLVVLLSGASGAGCHHELVVTGHMVRLAAGAGVRADLRRPAPHQRRRQPISRSRALAHGITSISHRSAQRRCNACVFSLPTINQTCWRRCGCCWRRRTSN